MLQLGGIGALLKGLLMQSVGVGSLLFQEAESRKLHDIMEYTGGTRTYAQCGQMFKNDEERREMNVEGNYSQVQVKTN